MHIAILGTRGIPNSYGGFEQCAEKISLFFVKGGHKVTVYNPQDHPYIKNTWHGITIKHIYSNENKLKFINLFIYDFLCLRDALKGNYDVILELGYAPNSLFYFLARGKKIITHMDGIDWRREKWGILSRIIIKLAEKKAVWKSTALVADNPAIKDYLIKRYGSLNIFCIPYGAELIESPDYKVLDLYGLKKAEYFLLIARLEPENNISLILDGYLMAEERIPFIVIGGKTGKYGKKLIKRYEKYGNIRFLGGIYNYNILSSLRWCSALYFHGHSVGGTNPSLLEAMASNAFIVAHDNPFNRNILGEDAIYFKSAVDVRWVIKNRKSVKKNALIYRNREKIKEHYSWDKISEQYLAVLHGICKKTPGV